MPTTDRHTGELAAVKIIADGGTPVVFNACTGWEFDFRARTARTTASGNTMEKNSYIRADYRARARFLIDDDATIEHAIDLVGAAIDFAFMLKSTDTNGFITGQGLLDGHPVRVDIDEATVFELEIIPDGTALVIDNTPAT